eukprot:gb/GECG01001350.1/.p1 GENE.gb/GECG01001350.1/~~gb/GECG01001350.1/.p1  ORF type:complete len:172 (+),score=11.84 gb/GECG01001350.1/:1-516(+)
MLYSDAMIALPENLEVIPDTRKTLYDAPMHLLEPLLTGRHSSLQSVHRVDIHMRRELLVQTVTDRARLDGIAPRGERQIRTQGPYARQDDTGRRAKAGRHAPLLAQQATTAVLEPQNSSGRSVEDQDFTAHLEVSKHFPSVRGTIPCQSPPTRILEVGKKSAQKAATALRE